MQIPARVSHVKGFLHNDNDIRVMSCQVRVGDWMQMELELTRGI